MKKYIISLAAFAVALTGTQAFAYNTPQLSPGDSFATEEGLRLTSELIGPDGYIEITMDAVYEVLGATTVTHITGSMGTYEVFEVSGSGSMEGNGEVSISEPIPINGPARLINGSYEATGYYSTDNFAAVKKSRRLAGTAEYQLPSGFWLALGEMVITENEEYDPPLPEVPFPLSAGDTGSGTHTLNVFGEIDAAGLITEQLEVTLDLSPSWSVSASTYEGYETLRTVHNDPENDLTLTTEYSCEAGFPLLYEISNLPIGGSGLLEYIRVKVTEFDVAGDHCQGGGNGGDPVLGLTSPQTAYSAGQDVSWTVTINNPGGELNGNVWLALELFGEYYFYNYKTGEFPHMNEGLTWTPETVPAGAQWAETFLSIPNFPAVGGVPLTWIAGWQTGNGDFWDQFPMITTTHE